MKDARLIFLAVNLLFWFQSCKGPELKTDSLEPANLMLRFSDPLTFEIEIGEESKVDLGVGLYYFEEKVKFDKSEKEPEVLPLYCILMHKDSLVKDKKFEVRIRNKKDWIGEKTEKSGEKLVKSPILSDLKLGAGSYKFKLYSNSPGEENITGISKVMLYREKIRK